MVHETKVMGNYDVTIEYGEETEEVGWSVNWLDGDLKLWVESDGLEIERAVGDPPLCIFEYETTDA